MPVKLNTKGNTNARSLIKAKAVNLNSAWSFSAADGNKLLGDNGDDWANYSKWFLGKDDEADENTKTAYKYPFGKNGKVYRKALTAIRQRAGQQGADAIFEAAGKLLEMIDAQVESRWVMNTLEISPEGAVDIPQRIHILTIGKWTHPEYGEFEITEDDLKDIVRNFNNMARWLVIDYEHQTLKSMEAPAAGWITSLEIEGGTDLYATVDWTERAEQYIRSKEYRFVSPVIWFNAKDKDTGADVGTMLHSLAITNTPFLEELEPLAAKDINLKLFDPKENAMKELFAKLAVLFSLKADAKPEDVVSAVEKYRKESETSLRSFKDLIGKLQKALALKEDAKPEDMVQKILALSDPGKFVSLEDFKKLQSQLHERDVQSVIDDAKKAGKVVPANEEWAKAYALKDLEGFKKYLETAPVVINLKNSAPIKDQDGNPVTPEEAQVAEMLGIEVEKPAEK